MNPTSTENSRENSAQALMPRALASSSAPSRTYSPGTGNLGPTQPRTSPRAHAGAAHQDADAQEPPPSSSCSRAAWPSIAPGADHGGQPAGTPEPAEAPRSSSCLPDCWVMIDVIVTHAPFYL